MFEAHPEESFKEIYILIRIIQSNGLYLHDNLKLWQQRRK